MSTPTRALEDALLLCVRETGLQPRVTEPGWFWPDVWTFGSWASQEVWVWGWDGAQRVLVPGTPTTYGPGWFRGTQADVRAYKTPLGILPNLGGVIPGVRRIERAIAQAYQDAGLIADAVARIEALRTGRTP